MSTKAIQGTDIYVGAKIREGRILLGMSQEGLANKLDLTFQQVQNYEKGTNRVSCSRLAVISTVLRQPIPWFFPKQVSTTPPDDPMSIMAQSNQGIALARAFAKMTDESRHIIVRIATGIAALREAA